MIAVTVLAVGGWGLVAADAFKPQTTAPVTTSAGGNWSPARDLTEAKATPAYSESADAAQPPESVVETVPPADDAAVPTTITVPAWQRTFDVKPVGVDVNGALIIPEDIDEVGWWADGARPGEGRGRVVMAVHRDSRVQGRGAFADLENLPVGTAVHVDDRTYVLDSTQIIPKSNLPADQLFDQTGAEALVVITCGGSFFPGKGYDANVVALFSPAGS